MLRYTDYDIVFREIPDETTLAVNLAGCPNRCPGCHSPQLQEPIGEPLTEEVVERLLARYGAAVTCFCLMGGDAEPHEAARLALFARRLRPALRTGWYSGRAALPEPGHIAYAPLHSLKFSPRSLLPTTTPDYTRPFLSR